jgi:tetratricopeptide (TPR) repeat protein
LDSRQVIEAITVRQRLNVWMRCQSSRAVLNLATVVLTVFAFGDCVVAQVDLPKRLERAASLIASKNLVEADQELSAILKTVPREPTALNLLGALRAQQGRLKEAEILFSQAVRGDPGFVGPHLNLAYLYTLMGQPAKTIAELREVRRLDPKNTDALNRLARLLFSQGRTDEGIEVLEQAAASQTLPSSLLVLLGDAYLKKGDSTRADKSYNNALAQDSEQTDAVLGLAQLAQLKGDGEAGLKELARARKMVANSPDTLYRFATVAMRASLFEEANNTLLAAIKLKSDDAAYFIALGNTWIKKPDLIEAELAFRQALRLRPDDALTEMYLGYTLLEQKKYAGAREYLEKSLEKDKGIPETYFYLGELFQDNNDDERAIQFFKKAIELVPSYAYAHTALGASYLRLKNYPMAQQELELSIKLDPNDPKAHYNLAVLFARLQNQKRAQEEMQIVEKLKSKTTGRTTAGELYPSPAPKVPFDD